MCRSNGKYIENLFGIVLDQPTESEKRIFFSVVYHVSHRFISETDYNTLFTGNCTEALTMC